MARFSEKEPSQFLPPYLHEEISRNVCARGNTIRRSAGEERGRAAGGEFYLTRDVGDALQRAYFSKATPLSCGPWIFIPSFGMYEMLRLFYRSRGTLGMELKSFYVYSGLVCALEKYMACTLLFVLEKLDGKIFNHFE